MKSKTSKKGEFQPAKPSVVDQIVASAASAAAAAPAPGPEIETAETLEARGWNRTTLGLKAIWGDDGMRREDEVIVEPEGRFWILSEWSLGGPTIRSERKQISRGRAVSLTVRTLIPEEFHQDLRECEEPWHRLEKAIGEAETFMALVSESDCLHRYGTPGGDRGQRLQCGIDSMGTRIGEELVAAFYAGEFRAAEDQTS